MRPGLGCNHERAADAECSFQSHGRTRSSQSSGPDRCAPSQACREASSSRPNRYGILLPMGFDLVDVGGFQMAARDPFLEALIAIVSEPNGLSTAQHAYEAARDWWDEHSQGPTPAELLDAMFEPHDCLTVIADQERPRGDQEAHLQLLRDWLLLYWCRTGAISFTTGAGEVVRPGSLALAQPAS